MVDDTLAEMVQKTSVKATADKLGYTYAYIHQVISGKLPVSKPLKRKLRRLKPHPPTLPVRFESEADKNLVRDRLTNDERAKLLREAAERKDNG